MTLEAFSATVQWRYRGSARRPASGTCSVVQNGPNCWPGVGGTVVNHEALAQGDWGSAGLGDRWLEADRAGLDGMGVCMPELG